ncbi:hypothetical protein [Embleya sp. MST-111070]
MRGESGAEPVRLPEYGPVLLASGELPGDGVLPGDTAAWYAVDGD